MESIYLKCFVGLSVSQSVMFCFFHTGVGGGDFFYKQEGGGGDKHFTHEGRRKHIFT